MSRVPIAFVVVLVEILLLAVIKPRANDEEGLFFRRTTTMGATASTSTRTGGLGSSLHHRYAIPPSDDVLHVIQNDDNDNNGNGTRPEFLSGERISVLVWNIQKQKDAAFWETFHRLARGRHLVLLQELHLKDENTKDMLLAQNENAPYTMSTSFIYLDDLSRTGVAIGSPVTPTRYEAQTTTPDVEPIIGTPKASVLAEFPLAISSSSSSPSSLPQLEKEDDPSQQNHVAITQRDGSSSLLVVSVHGLNRAPFAAFERQMDALEHRLAQHGDDGPILLAGDFNTQSKRKTQYLLDKVAGRLGLQVVSFDNSGSGEGEDCRTVSKLSRRPLDHVLVRGLSVQNASCWQGGSDHAALTLDLVVPLPPASRTTTTTTTTTTKH